MDKDLKKAILDSYDECEVCKVCTGENEKDTKSDKHNKSYKIRKQFIMDELSNDRKFSQAIVVDYLNTGIRRIYVAGQASPYPDEPNQGNFQAAIDKVFADIKRYVELGGGQMNDLVETNLISPGEWTDDKQEALQNTRTKYFGENSEYPISTAIIANLVFTTLLVEVNAIAELTIPKKWKVKPTKGLIIRTTYQ